jgi:nucleoid-associated protein YgaU
MIVTGSRYMGQPVVSVITTDQKTQAVYRSGSPRTAPAGFSYYTVIEGDRLDLISTRIYGTPVFWWRIADANPEVWYPQDLVVGSLIRIPA